MMIMQLTENTHKLHVTTTPPHVLVHTAILRYITSDINVKYVNLHVCKSTGKICSGVVTLKMHGSNIQLHCVTCQNYQTRVGMYLIYL